jgi:hypothetical protein
MGRHRASLERPRANRGAHHAMMLGMATLVAATATGDAAAVAQPVPPFSLARTDACF